jgi:hypothetical protein
MNHHSSVQLATLNLEGNTSGVLLVCAEMAQLDAGILHLGSLSFHNSCVIGDRYLSIAPCVERTWTHASVALQMYKERYRCGWCTRGCGLFSA